MGPRAKKVKNCCQCSRVEQHQTSQEKRSDSADGEHVRRKGLIKKYLTLEWGGGEEVEGKLRWMERFSEKKDLEKADVGHLPEHITRNKFSPTSWSVPEGSVGSGRCCA